MHPVTLDNIYDVFGLVDGKAGGVYNRRMGRLVVTPSEISVLSDYHGALSNLAGPMDARRARRLQHWAEGSHSRVIPLSELRAGRHPELLEEHRIPAPLEGQVQEPEQWFRVERPDLKEPLVIKFHEGQAYMHGNRLGPVELRGLLDHARAGRSRVRHHTPGDLGKAEQDFEDLGKVDRRLEGMSRSGALGAVLAAVEAGHLEPDVLHALHREIFYDSMVPGLRNKKAYHDEIAQPRPAGTVHVMLDGNSFKSINDTHGHEAGDQAIKVMGGAVRDALDEVVGQEYQDAWRVGGDEMAVALPSHGHAARFLRSLRSKLEVVPPVGGTHQLSMSAGVAVTPKEADTALYHAKAAKRAAGYLPGQDKMHVHSLAPGFEGAVPLDDEAPKPPPPAPEPTVSKSPATANPPGPSQT